MSVAVELSALAEHLERFGSLAYVTTVADDGRPHVVSVRPELDAAVIRAGAGRRTLANCAVRPFLTLLWPAPPGTSYCLIVDGEVAVHGDGEGASLEIRPTGAVLHRTPEGDPSSPSCITVLGAS